MDRFEKNRKSMPPEFYKRIKGIYDGEEDITTLAELKAYWLWVVAQREANKRASGYEQGQIASWGRSAIEPTSVFPKIHKDIRLERIHDEFASLEWPWLGSDYTEEDNNKHADAQWNEQKRNIEALREK